MSWGYWGIVAGLVALLVMFFVSMEILYSRARRSVGTTDSPAGTGNGESASGKKHAA